MQGDKVKEREEYRKKKQREKQTEKDGERENTKDREKKKDRERRKRKVASRQIDTKTVKGRLGKKISEELVEMRNE